MGTLIRKLALGLALMVGCIGFTMNAHSTEVISKDPAVVMITDFSTYSLAEFMKATYHLKDKDTLKVISVGHGGDAITCMSMINHIEALQTRGVKVTTEIQGLACSANAFIWMAGDERVIHRHDLIMFHEAYISDGLGQRMAIDKMSPLQQMILTHLNNYIRFKLTRAIGDTEIVNNMLDDPDNWYKGIDLFSIGVATKLIEN